MPLALFSPEFDATFFATLCHANGLPDEKRAFSLLKHSAKTEDEQGELELLVPDLLREIGESADPPRALLNFSNLCDRVPDKAAFLARLKAAPPVLRRLCRLFSWSQALCDAVIRDPQNLELLFEGARAHSRGELRKLARDCADLGALRSFRRAQFLRIGLLDLESGSWRDAADFELVVRQISDLAQVIIARTLELLTPDCTGFCVILMGKGGARELNYSSDVDLIFLSDERPDAIQLGERLLRELGALTPDGFLWRADVRLRPDGGAGPLVTPFGYALSYYESYAGAWEWQALIKARAVAGDPKLARRFRRFTRQITWARRPDDAHLREVFEMKRRSEKTGDGQNPRNLKSGPGGIRDAEWVVQQLQMMIGPTHPRARAKDTLSALQILESLDALSADEARTLAENYLWLRVAEHRLQLWNEQAVRDLPQNEAEKAALARRLGCSWRGNAAARFLDEEKSRVSGEVRALTERIFWAFSGANEGDWLDEFPGAVWGKKSPLLSPLANNAFTEKQKINDKGANESRVADSSNDKTELKPILDRDADGFRNELESVSEGLEARKSKDRERDSRNDFPKPREVVSRLERLANGTSTKPLPAPFSRQVRAVLPRAFSGFERAADPERALVAFENLADASGNRLSLFRALAESPRLGSALWTILGGSQSLSQTLVRSPQLLDFAANRALLASPRTREEARFACRDYVFTFQDAGSALRRWRARELLRIGLRDLVMNAPPAEISEEISFLAGACLDAAFESLRRTSPIQTAPLGILALGKWGGFEMHTSSDMDAIFVAETHSEDATRFAESLIRLLGERTSEGPGWELDARLRPYGAAGPLVTTLGAMRDYFEKPELGFAVWERQSLTRTRIGGGEIGVAARGMVLCAGAAFPEKWDAKWGDELRHIKARVESERAKRSDFFDAKLGRGTLSDIEWTAQWLALKHGARCENLQTPSTRFQLEAARDCELLSDAEFEVLRGAHNWFSRAQLRHQIAREGGGGAVKNGSSELGIWARAVFPDLESGAAREQFVSQWKSHAENVRTIFERIRIEL